MMRHYKISGVPVRPTGPFLRGGLIIWLAASAIGFTTASFAQQAGSPAPAVVVEKVEVRSAESSLNFAARVEAIDSVDIRARISGFLRSVTFKAGQDIKAGDALFGIEPAEFNALVLSARAQLSRAEAAQKAAETTLQRNRRLLARNTVSQAAFDDAQASFDMAVADVEVAQAALKTAELNLSSTSISAPISGSISRSSFTIGNLVGPESGPLARIISLDPIRIAFSVTEGELIAIRQKQAKGSTFDADALALSLRLANNSDYGEPGRLEFIENEANPQTGTVAARAIFQNAHRILIPGQFVTLSVRDKSAPDRPVVPQTAVLQDREGRFVFLLDKNNTVRQQRIDTGPRVDNGWAVTSGLTGGEKVIVQGTQRLVDGMTAQPSEGQSAGDGS